jgi:Helix-hairpin-helix motif
MIDSNFGLEEIKKICLNELERHYADNKVGALARLEAELAEVGELKLAGTLLSARLCLNKGLVIVARGLSGCLTAYLLGLSEFKPALTGEEFDFGGFANGYTLRLEVGRNGRKRLLAALANSAAPLACPVEGSNLPTLHPRVILVAYNGQNISKMLKLGEAEGEEGLVKGGLVGEELPEGVAKLEIAESSGVALFQLILDTVGKVPEITPDMAAEGAERAILHGRLAYFRQENPAGFYSAGLTLAHPTRRPQIANAVRSAGLKLLPPDVKTAKVAFGVTAPDTILSGLGTILNEATATKIAEQTDYQTLNDFIKRSANANLSAEDWANLIWSGAVDAFGERSALAKAVPAILAKAEEYRAQAAAEETFSRSPKPPKPVQVQLSLFDTPEPSQPGLSVPEVAAFVLGEAGEYVSDLVKLQRQRSVLGYDTSNHPLWNLTTEPDNPATALMLLGEALRQESGKPLVAGMINDLRRVTIAAGEELTVLQLADWSGTVEVIVPPRLVSPVTLEEGAVLAARVRRSKQGESAVLVAESIMNYPPQASELVPSVDEVVDFAVAGDNEPVAPEPPLPTEEPPLEKLSPDAELMQKLFFGDTEAKKPADTSNGADKNGKKEPPKKISQIHIHLPLLANDSAEEELIKDVFEILRRFPGEMPVNLYLPKPGGGSYHFQPQTTFVNGDAELIAFLAPLVGGTDKIKVE